MPSWTQNLDSPPMHFAVGMLCSGVLWLVLLLLWPRLWIYWPLVMTAGGVWAQGPDVPLLAKFYPGVFAHRGLGGQSLSETLHDGWWANLFFFHGWIDQSGDGGAVRGWAIAVALYTISVGALVIYAHWLRAQAG
jgi:hypothetical protein